MACFVCCFDNDDGEYIEAHCDGDYTEYGEGEKYFASRVTTARTWTHTMWKPGLPWKRSSTRGSPSPSDCQTSTSEADDDLTVDELMMAMVAFVNQGLTKSINKYVRALVYMAIMIYI